MCLVCVVNLYFNSIIPGLDILNKFRIFKYNLKNILSNINKDLVNIKFRDECFDYILSCHSEFSLREYIFLLEKIVMEINKLVFLEKKNIIDFFDIDLNILKTIHDKVTVKKQPSSHLSMYI